MARLTSTATVLCLMLIFAGCTTTGPAVSKSKLGNLQINLLLPEDPPIPNADVYLDGAFIGNISPDMPVIYARKGERQVRVEAPGYKTFERTITILGEPNHQVLNVNLKQQ